MEGLKLVNIHKVFGQTHALGGVSLELPQGEIAAVLGPSGSGKSTLLWIIAGLERPSQGDIYWNGEQLDPVPPHQRGFGLMFQDFALFPHMNVFDNIAFGLRMGNKRSDEITDRVNEVLERVGLQGFRDRDVNSLSGGEQQRVALARSLAPSPRLLMLDEPLGSLDRNLRERLVADLREILQRMGQTAIYVTHDQEEAFTIADQVVVMNAGKVEQTGAPQEIYHYPASLFVARFLGLSNLIPGIITLRDGTSMVETALGTFPAGPVKENGEVAVLLRPDGMRLDGKGAYTLEVKLVKVSFRGSVCRVIVEKEGMELSFDFLSQIDLPLPGQTLQLSFDPTEALQVLPETL